MQEKYLQIRFLYSGYTGVSINHKLREMKRMKHLSIIILGVFAALCPIHLSSQISLTLQPDSELGKDAHINSNFPSTNYGSERGVYSAGWTWSAQYGTVRSFIEFDQSSIPANATILSANLSLFNDTGNTLVLTNGKHSNLTASNTSYVSRVTEPWKESLINWNNQPSFTEVGQVPLNQSTSPNQDYQNIDVTSIVQYFVSNPSENHGFVLRLQTEVNYAALIFASSDNINSKSHPKLEITYSVPLGLDESDIETSKISVFPNPSNGELTIDFHHVQSKTSLMLINQLGQIVHTEQFDNTDKVNLNLELPVGAYYLKFEKQDHREEIIKIVIE